MVHKRIESDLARNEIFINPSLAVRVVEDLGSTQILIDVATAYNHRHIDVHQKMLVKSEC
ncbi:9687_t:CDS:2 [Ambispora gerdemannii]|uniref:9687_t:CDS:1 n=1 Tax=Ambispora gerdemannii TaxID=144530 RepID=A0A9N8YRP7_9GLOM|nr:9687_t:CDS:2 [Ambispora gerdemannii]